MMLPSRRKSAEKKEKEVMNPRAFQSVYEIREIQFGGEFVLNGPGSRLTLAQLGSRPRVLLECEMS